MNKEELKKRTKDSAHRFVKLKEAGELSAIFVSSGKTIQKE